MEPEVRKLMGQPMRYDWMTNAEAAERLEGWRDAALDAACGPVAGSIGWILGRVEDATFKIEPIDQNNIFRHAADVVAYDRAISALGCNDVARAAEQLARAAIHWQQSRARVKSLRSIRGAFLCERAEPADLDTKTQDDPCWKNWRDGEEDREIDPVLEWCAPCRNRHGANEQLKAERRQHGARMRALMQLARNRAALFVPFLDADR